MLSRLPILLFLLFFSSLGAQEVLTIEECVELALKNNLNLQQTDLAKKRAEINLSIAEYSRWPSLNANASHSYFFGRTIDPTENTFVTDNIRANQFGINGGVDLFNGFQKKNNISATRLENAATVADHEVAENNIILSVALSFLQVLSAEEQVLVLENQAKNTGDQLDRVQRLIDAGVLAENEILQIQFQQSNDELAKINAQNAVNGAYLNLAQAMQYYEDFTVAKPDLSPEGLPSPDLLDIDMLYAEALKFRPEIRSSDLREEAALKSLEATKGRLYPRLALGFGASTNFSSRFLRLVEGSEGFDLMPIGFVEGSNNPVLAPVPTFETEVSPFFNQLDQNLSWNAGISLIIPIFNQYQVRKSVELAELNIAQTVIAQETTKNNLFQEMQQALFTARSAERSYTASKQAIVSAQRSLENIEKRYNLGVANSFEYSTATNNLLVAELQNRVAKYEYIFRMKVLDYYQGKEITL